MHHALFLSSQLRMRDRCDPLSSVWEILSKVAVINRSVLLLLWPSSGVEQISAPKQVSDPQIC